MAIGVTTTELKDLFEKERFPKSNWQFISLLVYFPIGLVLASLRFFVGLNACLAALILSRSPVIRKAVLRVLYLVLGINVEQDNKHERDKSIRVMVSNCVTKFDHIAFHLTTDCVSHSKCDSILPFNLTPGLHDFLQGNGNLVENLKSFVVNNDTPILIQPEDTTSGKDCLLKFNTMAAEVCNKVQPVALIVERPLWANTAPTVLGASPQLDFFWFLFSPYTVFKLKYLGVLHKEANESTEAFAERMRAEIASALTYKVSSFTASDKAEYEKRYLDELNRPVMGGPYGSPRQSSAALMRMTHQVAEVLPNVPHDVIMRDLSRTGSVDLTISNILEGVVNYTPQNASPPPSQIPSRSPSSTLQCTSRGFDAPIFSKYSLDRMASFQERKAKMVAEARQRYIEKKGLQNYE
ncbi:Ancient ubiquitous protein 1 [Nesidiocoris tenuis]|uniref:Lipid droplet-regulating VLDL assembly factor AUP1 n=1 Tax=Nesidiocoris tenuis TaxID=355587 RepID=A0ABN7AXQ9_9HEMI|nr:Ancient ubiquitous protein 1 [Nesidiocoris tenuis]